MAVAPILVAVHDRVYAFDSWRDAWRTRRGLYAGSRRAGWCSPTDAAATAARTGDCSDQVQRKRAKPPARHPRRAHGTSQNGHARSRTRRSLWDRAGCGRSCQRSRPVNPAWIPRSRQRGRDCRQPWWPVFRSSRVPATSPAVFRRECSTHQADAPCNCGCRSRSTAICASRRRVLVMDGRGTTSVLTPCPFGHGLT
jgi:hypothetical protein